MWKKHARKATVAAATMSLFAAAVQAQVTRTFNGSAGTSWTIPANWTPSDDYPKQFDRAVIPAGLTCDILVGTIAEASTVEIKATFNPYTPGILDINDGESLIDTALILYNHDNLLAHHSRIDGILQIGDARNFLKFVNADHIIAGRGSIEGTGPTGRVMIANGLKFTSRLAAQAGGVVGSMTFVSTGPGATGTFRNEGRVEARLVNGERALTFQTSVELDDSAGARWNAINCGTLCLNRESTLSGDFLLDKTVGASARLHINAPVDTSGTFTFNSGRLYVTNAYQGINQSVSFCFGFLGQVPTGCFPAFPCPPSTDCCITSMTPAFPFSVDILCNADPGPGCDFECGTGSG